LNLDCKLKQKQNLFLLHNFKFWIIKFWNNFFQKNWSVSFNLIYVKQPKIYFMFYFFAYHLMPLCVPQVVCINRLGTPAFQSWHPIPTIPVAKIIAHTNVPGYQSSFIWRKEKKYEKYNFILSRYNANR
jgi:hypothetical protein